jgi:hypothetical protein
LFFVLLIDKICCLISAFLPMSQTQTQFLVLARTTELQNIMQ